MGAREAQASIASEQNPNFHPLWSPSSYQGSATTIHFGRGRNLAIGERIADPCVLTGNAGSGGQASGDGDRWGDGVRQDHPDPAVPAPGGVLEGGQENRVHAAAEGGGDVGGAAGGAGDGGAAGRGGGVLDTVRGPDERREDGGQVHDGRHTAAGVP